MFAMLHKTVISFSVPRRRSVIVGLGLNHTPGEALIKQLLINSEHEIIVSHHIISAWRDTALR